MKRTHTLVPSLAAFFGVGLALAITASAGQRGVTSKEIVIGTHTDLSGPVAAWGVGSSNSARLRFDEANAAGGIHGRKIRYVVEDHQYQVPRAVQAANKLLSRDRVFALAYAVGTPMNLAVMKRQLAMKVPLLFPFTFAKAVQEPLHKLKFTVPSTYYSQMRSAVKYFVEKDKLTRVCAAYHDSDYGEEIHHAARDQAEAMGLQLAATTAHRPTDTDFNAAVLKLRAAQCQVIVLATVVRDSILIASTAKKLGWNPILVGASPVYEVSVSNADSGATEGLYAMTIVDSIDPATASKAALRFAQEYETRYGIPPNVPAQIGYTHADITVRALEGAGPNLTTEAFVQALENIKGYEDIFGGPTLGFGPQQHHGSDQAFLAQVRNGKWVRVTDAIGY